MHKILLVEDSPSVYTFLAKKIEETIDVTVDVAKTFEEAKALIKASETTYFLSLLDVHLPDSDDTTTIDFLIEAGIPTIVMTSDFNDEMYQAFNRRNIIDYVLKETPESILYIVTIVSRVYHNHLTKVLVIDDSITFRSQLKYYLQSQLFEVYSASDPLEGLHIIEKEPRIKMVITDYNMPNMNGVEFLKIIRRNASKNKMAVVGISSDDKSAIAFLKHGANDFVKKPFFKEEFICRVNNTADFLDNVDKLEEIANKDYLTKVSNRKYFFEKADQYFRVARDEKMSCAVAMIDVDNFKRINDTYGHSVGDEVIKTLADMLKDNIKGQDIVARFGGEEFILYLKDIMPIAASKFLKNLCRKIANHTLELSNDHKLKFTVSIGVATQMQGSLTEMINEADKYLYEAKQHGKNMVVDDLVYA